MPWKCPACGTQIRHSDVEDRPRLNKVYRCHICRLELVFREKNGKLTVALLPEGCRNPVTPPQARTRERHRRDDHGAECGHHGVATPWQPAVVAPVASATARDGAGDRCSDR